MKYQLEGLKWLGGFVLLLWGIEVANIILDRSLLQFGLMPRDLGQWYGIITFPLLHGGIVHLLSNSIPLLILGFLVHQTRELLTVTLFVIFTTGILVWLFGREALHVGASGLVMGYWGYLLSYGYFRRSMQSIIISLLTLIFYGGMVFSLLDFRQHISFEGHIFGFISGVLCAWVLVKTNHKAQ